MQNPSGAMTQQAQGISPLHHVTIDNTLLETKSPYVQYLVPKMLAHINQQIDELNARINAYNNEADPYQKSRLLDEIKRQTKWIQDSNRGDVLNALPDLRDQLHIVLFNQLRIEGELVAQTHLSSPPLTPPTLTFDDLVSGMSPIKFSQFLRLLSHGANLNYLALGELYQAVDTSPEADRFRQFISSYDITFLGGGNAQNFKLTNNTTLEETVVKVEYRMGTPRSIEQDLRHSVLSDRMASIFSERQETFNHAAHGPTTCYLLQTELVKAGDLEKVASQYPDDQQRFDMALNLYGQMSDILLAMEGRHAAFPDAKNTNWLVDEHNRLMLADTKAFIPIEIDGTFSIRDNALKGFGCITTPYVNPPEITNSNKNTMIDANAMHVYMWGKNLYQFVTNAPYDKLEPFDFNLPVFSTPEGKLLKTLIQKATNNNPLLRIRLEDAKTQLAEIQSFKQLRQQTHETLDRLIAIDPSSTNNYKILRDVLNLANNLTSVQPMFDGVQLQLNVVTRQLRTQCEDLIQEISSGLAKIDAHQASVFETELETLRQSLIQNQDNPELVHTMLERLTIQNEILKDLNRLLARPIFQGLPQEDEQTIDALAIEGAKKLLKVTKIDKLDSIKKNLVDNFITHTTPILLKNAYAKLETLKAIDPVYMESYQILNDRIHDANRLGNIKDLLSSFNQVHNRFKVVTQQQRTQCEDLIQEISSGLAKIDTHQPSVFETELETLRQSLIQNQDNPELVHTMLERLTIQNEILKDLNRILAQPIFQDLPQEAQQATDALVIQIASRMLKSTDTPLLNNSLDHFEDKFMKRAKPILEASGIKEKFTDFKQNYQKTTGQKSPTQPDEQSQSNDGTYNPLHKQ